MVPVTTGLMGFHVNIDIAKRKKPDDATKLKFGMWVQLDHCESLITVKLNNTFFWKVAEQDPEPKYTNFYIYWTD